VLVPSIGHPTRPSLVEALESNGERTLEVIGADMDPNGIGPFVVRQFRRVPARTDPHYIDRVLEICRADRVDVYYALGEEEAIAAGERADDFRRERVAVIRPGSPEMLRISCNKARYHEFFAQRGIPHARFKTIRTPDDVEPALGALGYPDEDVFVKPAVSKGGRGARLVSARPGRSSDVPVQTAAALRDSLAGAASFPELIAMEHLTGTYYSVDVLSADGRVLYAVPKIRVQGTASNTTTGEVDLNPATIELAERACAAFGFSFLQNYEMKLDRNGEPRIYDINPRGGTSLILCAAAGANIAYFAVKMALGEPVPKMTLRNGVRMLRYYKEFFRSPA
jgi:carbamoyl-phosphate synthase large subunit